jgi:hypothetical protein
VLREGVLTEIVRCANSLRLLWLLCCNQPFEI